jgi:hypothetical protein
MFTSRFKFVLSYFYRIWFLWALCLIVNIITFLYIFYKIRPSGQTLALQYNVLVGPASYGQGANLFLVPAIALLVTGINYFIYRTIKGRTEFLPLLTVAVSLFVQSALLFSVIYLAIVT